MTIESSSSSSTLEPLIYNVKVSSVGPGEMTRPDTIHEPTSIDLAMKLHYLKGVYYFKSHEALASITIFQIKEAMFRWLCQFYVICGRFRRFSEDSGRPYLKCNDCGARLMEAECAKTIEEWLELVADENFNTCNDSNLIFGLPIGPEIHYSPNVYLQITKFKCGGISLGLSWAHVLGDVHLASFFINTWGKIMAGHKPGPPPVLAQYKNLGQKRTLNEPLSIKWVDPVGDHWLPSLTTKMGSFSFHISSTQLARLQSKVSGSKKSDPLPPFESLCAIIWQCVAKFKIGTEPNVVTIMKHDSCKKNNKFDNENLVVSIVKTERSVVENELEELATLVMNGDVNEHEKIKDLVESERGALDVIVYGVNLTFVSFEEAAFYELELKGQKPVHASYWVDGIGEGGAVFVLPTSKDDGKGRFVTITLPEKELIKVKHELKQNVLQALE